MNTWSSSSVLVTVVLALLACTSSCHADQVLPCTQYHTVVASDTCDRIIAASGLFLADLLSLNPTLAASCANLQSFQASTRKSGL